MAPVARSALNPTPFPHQLHLLGVAFRAGNTQETWQVQAEPDRLCEQEPGLVVDLPQIDPVGTIIGRRFVHQGHRDLFFGERTRLFMRIYAVLWFRYGKMCPTQPANGVNPSQERQLRTRGYRDVAEAALLLFIKELVGAATACPLDDIGTVASGCASHIQALARMLEA